MAGTGNGGARAPFNKKYYKPNGRSGETPYALVFDQLLANNPDYEVVIKYYSSEDKDNITLRGILLTEDLSLNYSTTKVESSAEVLENYQRGLLSKLGSKAASLGGLDISAEQINNFRRSIFGDIQTVAHTSTVYLNAVQPSFKISIFIDPYRAFIGTNKAIEGISEGGDFNKTLSAVHGLVYPKFMNNSIVSGAIYSSPIMVPNTVNGLKEWMAGNMVYDYFDNKLCKLSIGRWFCIPGGLWCTDISMNIPTYVNKEHQPITIPQITFTFEYHRAIERKDIEAWFLQPNSKANLSDRPSRVKPSVISEIAEKTGTMVEQGAGKISEYMNFLESKLFSGA